MIIDYEAQITKAIRNESWQKAVEKMNHITSDNITIETSLIIDYEHFKFEVEDNPSYCEIITSI